MTGDDHANNGTVGRVSINTWLQPARRGRWTIGRRSQHLLHLSQHADRQRHGCRLQCDGIRDRLAPEHRVADYDTRQLESILHHQLASFQSAFPSLPPPRDAPDAFHRLEPVFPAAGSCPAVRHPVGHELLLSGLPPGLRTGQACSPARACRCALPPPTATSLMSTRQPPK